MGDITANISYKELRPSGSPESWRPAFALQDLMVKELARNIQMVLDKLQIHANFSSGVREEADYERLKKAGYNPSPTSDHFCGNVVSIDRNGQPEKYRQFGSHYIFAVGAADTIPIAIDIKKVFEASIVMTQTGFTKFGQIIHEKDPVKKTEWIHFANHPNSFFSPSICEFLKKPQYLTTIDGGKTYQAFTR